MHEPGPPRTTSVGESVELAPRSPDPDGTYEWTVRDAPADSAVGEGPIGSGGGSGKGDESGVGDGSEEGGGSEEGTGRGEGDRPEDEPEGTPPVLVSGATSRSDAPVLRLRPDAPGTYVLTLDAPDGTHRQRVRAFPDERRETELRVAAADIPVDDDAVDRVSLMWAHNERLLARDRPERDGDDWVLETRVPPGRHRFSFVANDDPGNEHGDVVEVPGPGRPRLSLDGRVEDRSDAESVVVLTADVEAPPAAGGGEGGRGEVDAADRGVGVEFLVDDRDAAPETVTRIESLADGATLAVPLEAVPDDALDGDGLRVHAVPRAERYGAAETVRIGRGNGDERRTADGGGVDERPTAEGVAGGGAPVAVTDPHAAPEWADAPTIYEAFVRSFAGDTLPTTFREIERRVPYLESLRVDALWLTPVLASPTEHGYHVTDYYETASDLGSREAFESLVETCHDAGIRVVFDLVINHTSRDHPAFQMHAAGVDAYADHYRRADGAFDVTGTDWAELAPGDMPEYYFNWRRIPNLNFDSPAVRAWLLDVVDEWAAVVDGFRADVAWGVPHGFWKEVADRVPDDVLLLDETLPHDPFYGEGEFDLHYDTSLYGILRDVGAGEAPASAVGDAFDRAAWLGFDDPSAQMRYVENHDEDRYLAEYGRDALKAAAATVFTLPGAPMIYAGQERGNETYRGPVRWHDGDNDLTDFHRDLAALREREPLLREGAVDFSGPATDVRVVDGDPERVTAYARTAVGDNEGADEADGDALFVVVNFATEPATVAVPEGVETDLFADRAVGTEVAVDAVAVLR
ncbi:alpha-amylase family glycosyl hydrolase [Halorubrum sp. Hd13]|uniref:alpha-amylase family glycosyl hydrolase n=1 Tax=Halorubrum sp. Hd13 TaxID=1480728 RepID=UPI000B988BBB|nr:alpha-amylase family glycosyl hydrolase [Halorubrum sp. Hd13]OYR45088.1 alpha amylase [Halorubrum sp. Hd13]